MVLLQLTPFQASTIENDLIRQTPGFHRRQLEGHSAGTTFRQGTSAVVTRISIMAALGFERLVREPARLESIVVVRAFPRTASRLLDVLLRDETEYFGIPDKSLAYTRTFLSCLILLAGRKVQASSRRIATPDHVSYVSSVKIKIVSKPSIESYAPYASTKSSLPTVPSPQKQSLCSNHSFLLQLSISKETYVPSLTELNNDTDQASHFTLFLQPNTQLLHPQARIIFQSNEVDASQSIPLAHNIFPEEVLAYSGYIIKQSAFKSWEDEEKYLDDLPHLQTYNPTWARILIHQKQGSACVHDLEKIVLEGAFEVDGRVWHIKAQDSYQRIKGSKDFSLSQYQGAELLVAWSDPQITSPAFSPLSGRTSFSNANNSLDIPFHNIVTPKIQTFKHEHSALQRSSHRFFKRSVIKDFSGKAKSTDYAQTIGYTDGCPKSRKVLYIGVAADCTYVAKYGSQRAARLAILTNVNTVSSVYEKFFNISLAIVELNIQTGPCPSKASAEVPWNIGCPASGPGGLDLVGRLNEFSRWRGSKGGDDGAGLWLLMTDCPDGNGHEVGLAWLGTMCKVDAEKGISDGIASGTAVTAANPNEWQVMAHELAHTLGAPHDCDAKCTSADQCCPWSASKCACSGNYIMTPTSTTPTSSFSPCSIGSICSSLKSGLDTSCLSEAGSHPKIQLQQCGNGIVEDGEECDPGSQDSPCCNASTCKFSEKAVCDPRSSDCCTETCQFADTSKVCRPGRDLVCDEAERCSGTSAQCPQDVFAKNGLSCGPEGSGLTCAAGTCKSRDQQCQSLGKRMKLDLKKACDPSVSTDCLLACVQPKNPNQCMVMQEEKFSEGLACGCGGFCDAKGECVGGKKEGCSSNWTPA
ncbi:hypothetical protein O181_058257 [Austropuccinia psidii MF-1]|uniref:Disintegrin and metalloproteinase domain-containing protein B n=1 Tax=Austropuccinia psidii MF-1 TaxID=1389203 RepID=A0A9Q3EEB2_9BASI|nr:hypothetical protein [Austropuccinia psidii MF-1]